MYGNIVSLVDSTGVPLNKSGFLGVVSGGGGQQYGDQITILQNSQNGFIQSHASYEGNGFQIKLDDMIDSQVDSVSMWLKSSSGSGSGNITCSAYNSDGSEIGDFGTYDLSALSTSYVKVTFDDESQVLPENAFIQIHDMSGLSPKIDINSYFIINPSPTPPASPFQFWAVRTGTMGNAPTTLSNNGGSGDYARTEIIYRKPI